MLGRSSVRPSTPLPDDPRKATLRPTHNCLDTDESPVPDRVFICYGKDPYATLASCQSQYRRMPGDKFQRYWNLGSELDKASRSFKQE